MLTNKTKKTIVIAAIVFGCIALTMLTFHFALNGNMDMLRQLHGG